MNIKAVQMKRKIGPITLLIIMCLVLGFFTTYEYASSRVQYIDMNAQRLQAILEGHAGNPWQYRIFSAYLTSMVLNFFKGFQIPQYITISFICVRVMEDTTILILSFLYYKELRLSIPLCLIGLVLITWGVSYSHYDSDFSFNTFFDIIFYLLAGLSILKHRIFWILPISVIAALNRETSGLIPFLLLAIVLESGWDRSTLKKVVPIFILALASYGAIFIGLRLAYGKQEFILADGYYPGLDLLKYNLFRSETWVNMISTLSASVTS